jgi:Protein of unknown function (DUF3800)
VEIFFADDSIQKVCKRERMGPLVGVGGVLVEEAEIRPLADAIDNIAAAFGIPKEEEIKWSPNRGSWIRGNLLDNRTECYRQVLEAAYAHRAKAIVICNDTARTRDSAGEAFKRCLDYLFERLSMNLEDRERHALIVADRPGGGKIQEDEFLAYFLSRVEEGTQYVLPNRLLLNVLTTPSHMVRHLQIADLVTGITTAMVAGLETYAGPLFPFVKNLFIANRPGGIAGTGLKIAPDSPRGNSLVNLYHWVLQEHLLHKGGGARAYPLPDPGFPFATNGLLL